MASEKQFENKIKKFLKDNGCWYVKVWGGGFQTSGIPDLICCVGGEFVAVEVKAANGKTSELQQFTIRKIQESGGNAMVLYPHQFEEFRQFILEILDSKRQKDLKKY